MYRGGRAGDANELQKDMSKSSYSAAMDDPRFGYNSETQNLIECDDSRTANARPAENETCETA